MTTLELQREAYDRATQGQSWSNYGPIFDGFTAKGIPAGEIIPRENVLTYHAWRAVGRQVRKGEKGVKVTTWIPMTKTDKETGEKQKIGRKPWNATVFHISQTDPIAAG